MPNPLPALALLLLVASVPAAPPAQPSESWKPRFGRFLHVQHFPAEKDAKPVKFTASISVGGSHKLDGTDCWYLTYNPGRPPVKRFATRQRLFLDKATGWLVKGLVMDGWIEEKIRKVGAASFLAEQPPPLPFVFLPFGKDKATYTDGKASFTLSQSREGERTVVQATFTEDKKERWKCVQRWKPGEPWWTDSELWIDGRRDCFCKAATGVSPPVHYPPTHAYMADMRLNMPVAVPGRTPTVSDLLEAVSTATGVSLKSDPALRVVKGDIGTMNGKVLGFRLLDAATRPLRGAGWRKEGTGWFLFGLPPLDRTIPVGKMTYGQLTLDPKLQVACPYFNHQASMPEILELLARTTKLEFTLDPKLARHDPRLGSIQMKTGRAWSLMSVLASRDLLNGHWEKTPTGYRLTADESLNLGPLPTPVPGSPLAGDALGAPHGGPPWWAIGSVGAIVVGLSGLFWWRFRKPAAAP